jgi:hypothetical protein
MNPSSQREGLYEIGDSPSHTIGDVLKKSHHTIRFSVEKGKIQTQPVKVGRKSS